MKMTIGAAMLVFPTGFMLYLIEGRIGFWQTVGLFIVIVGWTSFAIELLYKGIERAKEKNAVS